MKRYLVIVFLLVSASLLLGQPVADSALVQKKMEAVRLPDMNLPRASHNVFYVNGELTVVGGHTSGFVLTPTAEYFKDGAWHLMHTVYAHDDGMAVVLDGGSRVLLAGGHEKNLGIGQSYEAEMYYPETHTFEGFGCLDHKRALAQGVVMGNGEVLIAGNHQGNDSFEKFDGEKFFYHVKDVVRWHASPYVLPVAPDDAIVFGSIWRGDGFQPCDTVDRLKGEPFREPMLGKWMPMYYEGNSHSEEAFIGDKAAGDYSYIVSARTPDGEVTFLLVQDTVFSILPTVCPVPSGTPEWGPIQYERPAIVDRAARRAYLVGQDTTGRAYVVAVDYDKRPAPLIFYYTEPLEDFGFITPVLTPDGDLIVTGGLTNDNFTPFSAVWLLPVSGRDASEVYAAMAAPVEDSHSNPTIWWILGILLLLAVIVIAVRRFASLTNFESDDLRGGTTKQSRENASSLPRFARNDEPDQESVSTEQIVQPEQIEQPEQPEQVEQQDQPEQQEQPEQFEQQDQPEQQEQPEQEEQPEKQEQPEQTDQPEPSASDSRPNPTLEGLLARITQMMETERLYLNPELKLADVAHALGVHRNMVSACINAQGSTFSQLVNDYRVQYAKTLLSQSSDKKMSAIGLESGFANERTFFRVFKDATGQTPKEWAAER